jgi:DNA repair protein RecO (recombination protein O)
MRQQTSPAIVLRRTNYGEADRIVTFLTPTGKIKAMVKGVRRSKSKLAGGIELFSESTITFLQTSGDLQRIVSTRLEEHWDGIIGDLQRTMFGYEAMKLFNKILEDEAERDYYDLLKATLTALSDIETSLQAIEVWFYLRILKLTGHEPNLTTDSEGKKLAEGELYRFDSEHMCFTLHSTGDFRAEHIKFLRLCISHQPGFIKQIKNIDSLTVSLQQLLQLQVKQRFMP